MRLVTVVAVIALLIPLSAFCQSANLVRNPGFEDGTNTPSDWDLGMEGRGAGSATWVTDDPHSGKRCVRIEMLESGDYWMARQSYGPGTALPEHRYLISGWYKADEGVCHPTVYSRGKDNGFLGAWELTLPPAADWQPFSFVFTTKPGADRLELQLRCQGQKGVCWYDDIAIRDAEALVKEGQQRVAPLLKLAADNPGYLWALVADGGNASWQFVGRPAVEVAWAVGTAAGVQPLGNCRIDATTIATGGQTKREQVALNPANPELQSKRVIFSAAGIGPAKTVFAARNESSGSERILLVGVKVDQPVSSSLASFEALPLPGSDAGLDLPWTTRPLPDSVTRFAAIKAANRNDLLRRALAVPEGQAGVRVCDGWANYTDEQWLDWALSRAAQRKRDVVTSGARNEYVTVQALFAPPGQPQKVSASVSALAGGGATIPASACQVRMLEYVPFNGHWLPDPLFEDQPFTPSAHGPVVFWVTIHIPEGVRPGIYRGTLSMSADDGRPIAQDFAIRVWDFTLPQQTHLQTSFWLFRGQIKLYFDLKGETPMEMYYPYIDLATSHRLSPIDVLEGPCQPLVKVYREADGKLSYDFTEWDKYLDRMKLGGANTIHLAATHWIGNFFCTGKDVIDRQTGQAVSLGYTFGSKEHLDALGDYLRACGDHLKQRGEFGKCYVQPWDEPNGEGLQKSHDILQGIKERVPDVPRLMDAIGPNALDGKMRDVVNLWCPLSPGAEGGAYDAMRQRGDTLWWYVCCGPQAPYANLFTNWKVAEMRSLFWQTWQYHCTGVLYWGLNYWNSMDGPTPPEKRRFPNGPWSSATTGSNYMGDGYFIYPGKAPDKPLSSLRLETIRDGIEDYEMLYLLNSLVAKNPKADAATLDLAREVLAVRPQVSKNLTNFDRTGEEMEAERAVIARLIEKLQ
jgi:hypothetical protein